MAKIIIKEKEYCTVNKNCTVKYTIDGGAEKTVTTKSPFDDKCALQCIVTAERKAGNDIKHF